jgi:hypothetical protein
MRVHAVCCVACALGRAGFDAVAWGSSWRDEGGDDAYSDPDSWMDKYYQDESEAGQSSTWKSRETTPGSQAAQPPVHPQFMW